MEAVASGLPVQGSADRLRRQWRRRSTWLAALILGVAVSAIPVLALSKQGGEEVPQMMEQVGDDGLSVVLKDVSESLRPLQQQVESGHLVPKFGERAQTVLATAERRAGSAGPELARAVDGMLQGLYLRQLALLRQQLTAKFERSGRPAEAVAQADQQFVTQAEELRRPGSSWSYDQERYSLRAVLEGIYRREAALAEERALATKAQQSTVEVISKLQSQMETLQQKVHNLRAGSPWFLSTSYRVPGTPLQIIGRYQQGRANIELNLSPDRDPANAEAGFVEGVGPANLGLSVNLGV